jgi:hypothetical protein
MPETMSFNDPVAAAAQRYKPVQSAVPGTTLGPIPINAFLGGGVCLYGWLKRYLIFCFVFYFIFYLHCFFPNICRNCMTLQEFISTIGKLQLFIPKIYQPLLLKAD